MAVAPEIPGLTDWRPLARGGFALVWQARQEPLNRQVAVKVDDRSLDEPPERDRFLREAGAAARMSGYPGIVSVHVGGILPEDNRPYLVMELCTGGSLTKWLQPEHRATQERVREVGVRIADALAATHERGVLHRDVKPANILIDSYGQAGLADFGLAAIPDPEDDEATYALEALTPAYAPPEVFRQERPTTAGDVYSLAATLYALLSGRPPHGKEDSPTQLAVMAERHSEPIERIPGVDDAFMDLLLAAMHPDPTARPTAAEFRDRLRALPLGTDPGTASTGPVATYGATATTLGSASAGPESPPGRRSRWLVGGVLVAALAVLATLVVPLLRDGDGTVLAVPSVSGTPAASTPAGPATDPSPQPSPDPTRTASPSTRPPAGFVSCDGGRGVTYCPEEPECWSDVNSYANAPATAILVDCTENHLYQTFLAGPLSFPVRRQPDLEADRAVTANCTRRKVNQMLAPGVPRLQWQVYAIPPQDPAEPNVYRCLFHRGERTGAIPLVTP